MEQQMQFGASEAESISAAQSLAALRVEVPPAVSKPAILMPLPDSALTHEDTLVLQHLARMRSRNAVRQASSNAFSQVPLEDIAPLCKALSRPFAFRWKEAQAAAWTLGRATLRPEQTTAAQTALTKLLQIPVPRTRMRRMRTTQGLALTALVLALPGVILVTLHQWFHYHIRSGGSFDTFLAVCFVFAVGILAPLTPFSLMIDAARNKRRSRVRATAAAALGRIASPDSVDTLAETLRDTMPTVHKAALRALVPLLASAHYGRFDSHVTSALGRALHDKDEAWVLDCLNALEKVGDSSAIPAVERVARIRTREAGEEKTSRRIRERAEEVLTALEQRKAQDNAPRHLLRASSSAQAAPDVLLRPAMGDTPTDGAQLLRGASEAGEALGI